MRRQERFQPVGDLRAMCGHVLENVSLAAVSIRASRNFGAHLRGFVLATFVALLWVPLVRMPGIVFTRDPAFFSTVHADVSFSLGVLSPQGGASNLSSQGLFYEPYSLVEFVLGWMGLSAAMVSKVLMVALSSVAVGGCYRLLRAVHVGPWTAVVGAGVFLLNPWSLDEFGYFFIWSGYCMLPLVVLGTAYTVDRGRPSVTLLVALAFSGGLLAWTMATIAAGLTVVAHASGRASRPKMRRLAWLPLEFGVAAAYWVLPYMAWVLHPGQGEFSQFATVTSGLLQSPYPITGAMELRDFWWPHLEPAQVVGYAVAAVGELAAMVLVVTVVAWSAFIWSGSTSLKSAALRRTTLMLMLSGAVLGVGTAGPTGWLYAAVHDSRLPGHAFVAAVTRSPANFLGLFVAGLVVALAAAMTYMRTCTGWRGTLGVCCVCAASIVACWPSVLAFWHEYRPIHPPSYYGHTGSDLQPGLVLEVGLWQDVLISPADGVHHFVWSDRMVADPTVLASFVAAPSLAPALTGTDGVGTQVLRAVTPSGVHRLEALAAALHIRTLVMENDLIRSGGSPWPPVIRALRADGLTVRAVGPLDVVSLSRANEPAAWVGGCQVSSTLALFGTYHLSCPSPIQGQVFRSAFVLPGPFLGIGLEVGPLRSISAGMGTATTITGQKGWLVSLPGVLAALGLFVTALALVVGASARARSGLRWSTSARRGPAQSV